MPYVSERSFKDSVNVLSKYIGLSIRLLFNIKLSGGGGGGYICEIVVSILLRELKEKNEGAGKNATRCHSCPLK